MPYTVVLKNFHIIDEKTDTFGHVVLEDGIIRRVFDMDSGVVESVAEEKELEHAALEAGLVINGRGLASHGALPYPERLPVLMPAFVDLHAHFRDPGFPEKETLESASLAAVAGGYGTVAVMANTAPATDTLEKAAALKGRSGALGLIDVYPVISLTKNMEGKELSGIKDVPGRAAPGGASENAALPLMLSEDGKDLAHEGLFLAAMKEARRIGAPVSCHCDFGGEEAEAAKQRGEPPSVWSRIEENNGVRRAIELGKAAGCHIHIAHVSTKEAVETIRRAKAEIKAAAGRADCGGPGNGGCGAAFFLSCEAMPHNIVFTEERARELGDKSYGRVNPPLRAEEDCRALVTGLLDGTIDAVATDHAPHTMEDKAKGAPGFSGLETAFAACYIRLVKNGPMDLRRLSSLMSAAPARLLGFGGAGPQGRGRIAPGFRGDVVIVDPQAAWKVEPEMFKTRGKNSAFAGRELWGKVLMTLHGGQVVFSVCSIEKQTSL
jgi:dihydroorotase